MSNRLSSHNPERKKPSKGRKLLVTGAALLALSGTACADKDSGVALPSNVKLENVEISPEDARATINDRIENRATTGAAQILELINRDNESDLKTNHVGDRAYSIIGQDKDDANILHVIYQFNYTPPHPDSVPNGSQFRVFMSLGRGADGNLDPETVSTLSIERTIPVEASNVWQQGVSISSDQSGQWQMNTNHTSYIDGLTPDPIRNTYGGNNMRKPQRSVQTIESDLDQSFSPLLAELVMSVPA